MPTVQLCAVEFALIPAGAVVADVAACQIVEALTDVGLYRGAAGIEIGSIDRVVTKIQAKAE